MKLLPSIVAVLSSAFIAVACCFLPLPSPPAELIPQQQVGDSPVNVTWPDALARISLHRKLQPVVKQPKVPPRRVVAPPKPNPLPPLKLQLDVIGVVLSGQQSHVVLQTRSKTLLTLSEGQALPSPHEQMVVKKIQKNFVVFEQGTQTLQVEVDPSVR